MAWVKKWQCEYFRNPSRSNCLSGSQSPARRKRSLMPGALEGQVNAETVNTISERVKIVAEGIACKDDKGAVKAINPKFNRTFKYNVTASNLDKDVAQLIDHINAENRRQAAIAEN